MTEKKSENIVIKDTLAVTRIYSAEYLLKQIEAISAHLVRPARGYMIGGCAMSIRGLKRGTKDVDLVFSDKRDLGEFLKAIAQEGYKKAGALPGEYEALDAIGIYKNQRGMQVDVFLNTVCGCLQFSPAMQRRAVQSVKRGNLELFLASKEDILLFKGITERQRDIDDIRVIIESGVNWDTVLSECENQHGDVAWEGALYNKLSQIAGQGILIPILDRLLEKDDSATLAEAIHRRLHYGRSLEQAIGELAKDGSTRKEILAAWKEHEKRAKKKRNRN